MSQTSTIIILHFYPDKCDGCLECEKACSNVHFKTKDGGKKSAIHIIKDKKGYKMHVCDQRGLCLDMCPVGALSRGKNGAILLNKNICIGCQACVGFCPIGAMQKAEVRIEPFKCISCGACVRACPENALDLVDKKLNDIKQVVYHKLGV